MRRRLLELRETIMLIDARMSIGPPRAPTEVSWEEVSERVASEVGRVSEILNERNSSPELREWMSKAISDQASQAFKDRETIEGKFSEIHHERSKAVCEGCGDVHSVKVSSSGWSLSSCWCPISAD